MTYTIAITGGIASGKSAVSRLFAQFDVPVLDADVIAHALVAKGSLALAEISAVFGADFVAPSGELDRAKLRTLVFGDARLREKLENILHPRIRETIRRETVGTTAPYCICAIPLLAEARGDYDWIDRVLLTDISREEQIRRLVTRPGIDQSLAVQMIEAQVDRQVRFQIADDVVDTSAPIAHLPNVVARLHARYLQLAARL